MSQNLLNNGISKNPGAGGSSCTEGLKTTGSFYVQGIHKSFPGVHALKDVSLRIDAGNVHVLLGENGAGKSTLLKILSGALQPDEGTITLNGSPVVLKDPRTASNMGVATIYQELSLIPWLSIAHNLFLGKEQIAGRFILSRKKLHAESRELLDKIGVNFDPDTKVTDLGVASQQLVEIARALSQNAGFILMDEPTASLTEREINILFQKIDTLRKNGVGILYISHRLEEIRRIADQVTVMRDGEVVFQGLSNEITLGQIITKMVGRSIANHYPKRTTKPGNLLFEVTAFGKRSSDADAPENTLSGDVQPACFRARAGEVVGIAGLVGSGRTEWARRVFGADPSEGETVKLFNKVKKIVNPHQARQLGLGMVPENRKEHGLILGRTVRDNITVTVLEKISNLLGFIDRKQQFTISKEYLGKLSIRCSSDLVDINTLSGGNQQKTVLAKWLACKGQIIILDEPTRGIDVGAKLDMYNLINELCSEGKAVILITSDLPELISMSDRIYVMHQGVFTAELSANEADQETIMHYASGLKRGIQDEN